MKLIAAIHKRLLKQRRFRQALVGSILLALILGWLIVPIEQGQPGSSIRNTNDGLWWAVQTLTTVGYGDVVPVTLAGRAIGIIMVVLGAVMFGVIIAMISTSMSRSQEEFYWTRLFERLDRLENDLKSLRKETGFLLKDTVPSKTDPKSES